jgi:hypothetical protein
MESKVTLLHSFFEKIGSSYGKYLTLFNFFDPNSLGTISEVLLNKLLEQNGVKSQHVGGSQQLADLVIADLPVSLKTTKSTKVIGLGSDYQTSNAIQGKAVLEGITKFYSDHEALQNSPYNSYKHLLPADIQYKIEGRVAAISKKLTGYNNEEYFVWVEKLHERRTGVITGINIHTVKYDYTEVMDSILESAIILTEKAWGFRCIQNGHQIISPDLSGKYLNIHPNYVRTSTTSKVVNVRLLADVKEFDRDEIEKGITLSLFNTLDTVYTEMFNFYE